VQTLVSRRPEPLQPTTSVVEWDAKGQRAVRALIALVSSNFGHGVSGMAQVGAGRIAVTEHITGPSVPESYPLSRRRKGHADPGVASDRSLGWIKAVTRGRLVASWTVARGFGASGAVCPRGSGVAASSGALQCD
jgi:hypothetical protein